MTGDAYDVVVIGAGVIGCAIARELSRYELTGLLVEANTDLCDGASKGNTALMCSGYDTPNGSLERQLVRRGYERYMAEAPDLGLPIRKIGAATFAWTDEELAVLQDELDAAQASGFTSVNLLDRMELREKWPRLAPGATAALWTPEEAIVDPFSTPLAYALEAVANGIPLRSSSPVTAASRDGRSWVLEAGGTKLRSQVVINAAGLRADRVDALAGFDEFRIRPRRGEYILFDKSATELLNIIAKPTPTPSSRGILITPTIFGNVLVGPTAESVEDADDRRVTEAGLHQLDAAVQRLLPALRDHPVTTCFAGMRPASDRPEYRIIPRLESGWITVAGIRSTGLSAALGIAEFVVGQIIPSVLSRPMRAQRQSVNVPSLSAFDERPWTNDGLIQRDPRYTEIVCHCERVTLGEIVQVLKSPLPPRSLKALRRRTRAMFGRCQGFYCGARVLQLFESSDAKPPL
ncbi:MAG: NAD(P)/FAD-dependent oxidoreductase [Phycisphaerales bacterium]|nr:NAD(P)/FAD-dependent oxidoreductase [Phycisphaerales bacterium]